MNAFTSRFLSSPCSPFCSISFLIDIFKSSQWISQSVRLHRYSQLNALRISHGEHSVTIWTRVPQYLLNFRIRKFPFEIYLLGFKMWSLMATSATEWRFRLELVIILILTSLAVIKNFKLEILAFSLICALVFVPTWIIVLISIFKWLQTFLHNLSCRAGTGT